MIFLLWNLENCFKIRRKNNQIISFLIWKSKENIIYLDIQSCGYKDEVKLGISSVQFLSPVLLFAIPWTAAHQASLFITNSWSLLKLISSSQWCHPTISFSAIPFSSYLLVFPSIRVFSNESVLKSGGQSIPFSALTSVLPMTIQDWFPLGLTGLISLQSKGLSRVF